MKNGRYRCYIPRYLYCYYNDNNEDMTSEFGTEISVDEDSDIDLINLEDTENIPLIVQFGYLGTSFIHYLKTTVFKHENGEI